MTFICTDSKMREMFEQWYVEYVRTAYAQDDEEMIENDVEDAKFERSSNCQYELREIQNLWAGWCAGIELLMKLDQWTWDR